MSQKHIPPSLKQEVPLSLASGLFLGFAVMLLLPISQYITQQITDDGPPPEITVDIDPPVVDLIQKPEPPDVEEPKIDKPEEDITPPSIDQLIVDYDTSVNPNSWTTPDWGELIPSVGDSDFVALDNLTVAPRPLSQPRIVYPGELRSLKQEGMVVAIYEVRQDGSVGEIQIVESTHPAFEEAVRRGLRKMRFSPGEQDGRVVRTRLRQEFPFSVR